MGSKHHTGNTDDGCASNGALTCRSRAELRGIEPRIYSIRTIIARRLVRQAVLAA